MQIIIKCLIIAAIAAFTSLASCSKKDDNEKVIFVTNLEMTNCKNLNCK